MKRMLGGAAACAPGSGNRSRGDRAKQVAPRRGCQGHGLNIVLRGIDVNLVRLRSNETDPEGRKNAAGGSDAGVAAARDPYGTALGCDAAGIFEFVS